MQIYKYANSEMKEGGEIPAICHGQNFSKGHLVSLADVSRPWAPQDDDPYKRPNGLFFLLLLLPVLGFGFW